LCASGGRAIGSSGPLIALLALMKMVGSLGSGSETYSA
jgi:hypothetical protein